MYAVLLNPPRRRKRRRTRTRTRNRRGRFTRRRRRNATRKRKRKTTSKRRRTTKRKRRRGPSASSVKSLVCRPSTKTARSARRRYQERYCPAVLAPQKRKAAQSKWEGLRASHARRRPKGIASNPRRRRRRRRARNTGVSYSYNARRRRRRSRRRNYSHWIPAYKNPSWVPSYAMNPGGGVMNMATKAFKPDVLTATLPVVGGALGNAALTGIISGYAPAVLAEGPGNIGLGILSAGLLGGAANMVLPKQAKGIFLGGMIEVVTRGLRQYVLPMVPGLSGMGEYLTRRNVAEARPLGNCPGCVGTLGSKSYAQELMTGSFLPSFTQSTGMNKPGVPSFSRATGLNPYPYGMSGMSDYLSRRNAAEARPLGAYHYNDEPIEGVASDELAYGF